MITVESEICKTCSKPIMPVAIQIVAGGRTLLDIANQIEWCKCK